MCLELSEKCSQMNRAFSHDVTAAILVFQNKETAALLVFHTNPVGVELFSYEKNSFVTINLHGCWPREQKRSIPTNTDKKIYNSK